MSVASGSLKFPGWDVIEVLGVAARDRSNVPHSLGQSDFTQHTAPQQWRGRGPTVIVSAPGESCEILQLSLARAVFILKDQQDSLPLRLF